MRALAPPRAQRIPCSGPRLERLRKPAPRWLEDGLGRLGRSGTLGAQAAGRLSQKPADRWTDTLSKPPAAGRALDPARGETPPTPLLGLDGTHGHGGEIVRACTRRRRSLWSSGTGQCA